MYMVHTPQRVTDLSPKQDLSVSLATNVYADGVLCYICAHVYRNTFPVMCYSLLTNTT
jgi:hypothetical protein